MHRDELPYTCKQNPRTDELIHEEFDVLVLALQFLTINLKSLGRHIWITNAASNQYLLSTGFWETVVEPHIWTMNSWREYGPWLHLQAFLALLSGYNADAECILESGRDVTFLLDSKENKTWEEMDVMPKVRRSLINSIVRMLRKQWAPQHLIVKETCHGLMMGVDKKTLAC
jgi:hypothetical protein